MRRDISTVRAGYLLKAVADPKDGHAAFEYCWVDVGCVGGVNRVRGAGEDDSWLSVWFLPEYEKIEQVGKIETAGYVEWSGGMLWIESVEK